MPRPLLRKGGGPILVSAWTGSEIRRIAAKGGMTVARCKPEVTSGGEGGASGF